MSQLPHARPLITLAAAGLLAGGGALGGALATGGPDAATAAANKHQRGGKHCASPAVRAVLKDVNAAVRAARKDGGGKLDAAAITKAAAPVVAKARDDGNLSDKQAGRVAKRLDRRATRLGAVGDAFAG